jgi:hypothetical protein
MGTESILLGDRDEHSNEYNQGDALPTFLEKMQSIEPESSQPLSSNTLLRNLKDELQQTFIKGVHNEKFASWAFDFVKNKVCDAHPELIPPSQQSAPHRRRRSSTEEGGAMSQRKRGGRGSSMDHGEGSDTEEDEEQGMLKGTKRPKTAYERYRDLLVRSRGPRLTIGTAGCRRRTGPPPEDPSGEGAGDPH